MNSASCLRNLCTHRRAAPVTTRFLWYPSQKRPHSDGLNLLSGGGEGTNNATRCDKPNLNNNNRILPTYPKMVWPPSSSSTTATPTRPVLPPSLAVTGRRHHHRPSPPSNNVPVRHAPDGWPCFGARPDSQHLSASCRPFALRGDPRSTAPRLGPAGLAAGGGGHRRSGAPTRWRAAD